MCEKLNEDQFWHLGCTHIGKVSMSHRKRIIKIDDALTYIQYGCTHADVHLSSNDVARLNSHVHPCSYSHDFLVHGTHASLIKKSRDDASCREKGRRGWRWQRNEVVSEALGAAVRNTRATSSRSRANTSSQPSNHRTGSAHSSTCYTMVHTWAAEDAARVAAAEAIRILGASRARSAIH